MDLISGHPGRAGFTSRTAASSAKVNKLEENSKNKNIREMYKGINEFKKGYQPRAYVIKKHDGQL